MYLWYIYNKTCLNLACLNSFLKYVNPHQNTVDDDHQFRISEKVFIKTPIMHVTYHRTLIYLISYSFECVYARVFLRDVSPCPPLLSTLRHPHPIDGFAKALARRHDKANSIRLCVCVCCILKPRACYRFLINHDRDSSDVSAICQRPLQTTPSPIHHNN